MMRASTTRSLLVFGFFAVIGAVTLAAFGLSTQRHTPKAVATSEKEVLVQVTSKQPVCIDGKKAIHVVVQSNMEGVPSSSHLLWNNYMDGRHILCE